MLSCFIPTYHHPIQTAVKQHHRMPSRNLQLIASKMKDTLWPIFRQYARVCLLCQIYVCAPRSRELFQIPLICLLLILRKKCAVRRILSHVILMFKDSHRLFVEMVIALLISPIFLKQPNSMLEWNIGKNCVLNSGVLIAVRTASIKVFLGFDNSFLRLVLHSLIQKWGKTSKTSNYLKLQVDINACFSRGN